MAKERAVKKGDLVRRNRRIARVQRVTRDAVHLTILKDFVFRVYESEVVPRDQAAALLRPVPAGFYSALLMDRPERVESCRDSDPCVLMGMILSEYETAFGKREFKQILVNDDGVVDEKAWNSFWNGAYRGMRADPDFEVDEKGRYSLAARKRAEDSE